MTDIQQHQEYNKTLIMMAREKLMEDIDCIVSAQYGQGNEELVVVMIKLLCDAVCKNFPSNWLWNTKLSYTLLAKSSQKKYKQQTIQMQKKQHLRVIRRQK